MRLSKNIANQKPQNIYLKYTCFKFEHKEPNISSKKQTDLDILNILLGFENIYNRLKRDKKTKKTRNRLLLLKKGLVIGANNLSQLSISKSVINTALIHLKPYALYNNAAYASARKKKLFYLFRITRGKIKFLIYYMDKNDNVLKIETNYLDGSGKNTKTLILLNNLLYELMYKHIIYPGYPEIKSMFLYHYNKQIIEISTEKEIKVILTNNPKKTGYNDIYIMHILCKNSEILSLENTPVSVNRSQRVGNYTQKNKMTKEGLSKNIINLIKANESVVIYPDRLGVIFEEPHKLSFYFLLDKEYFSMSCYMDVTPIKGYPQMISLFEFVRYITGNKDCYIRAESTTCHINVPAIINKDIFHANIKKTICRN